MTLWEFNTAIEIKSQFLIYRQNIYISGHFLIMLNYERVVVVLLALLAAVPLGLLAFASLFNSDYIRMLYAAVRK